MTRQQADVIIVGGGFMGASAAFMTPVSSPVNTLVVVPGRYRFWDFVKVGTPMGLMVMVVSLLLIPLLFPL